MDNHWRISCGQKVYTSGRELGARVAASHGRREDSTSEDIGSLPGTLSDRFEMFPRVLDPAPYAVLTLELRPRDPAAHRSCFRCEQNKTGHQAAMKNRLDENHSAGEDPLLRIYDLRPAYATHPSAGAVASRG